MTTKLKWRLSSLPTPDEVRALVIDEVITKDEAREILFSSETEQERDKKSLEAEIKFLRELVEKLSNQQSTKIIETIKYIESPYRRWDWYKPYEIWCSSTPAMLSNITTSTGNFKLNAISTNSNVAGSNLAMYNTTASFEKPELFTKIKTF